MMALIRLQYEMRELFFVEGRNDEELWIKLKVMCVMKVCNVDCLRSELKSQIILNHHVSRIKKFPLGNLFLEQLWCIYHAHTSTILASSDTIKMYSFFALCTIKWLYCFIFFFATRQRLAIQLKLERELRLYNKRFSFKEKKCLEISCGCLRILERI